MVKFNPSKSEASFQDHVSNSFPAEASFGSHKDGTPDSFLPFLFLIPLADGIGNRH